MQVHHNDSTLIQRVLDGDTERFGELVDRYQGLIYGLAYDHVRNFSDAQDIAQEVFIKAYRKLDQLQEHSHFPSWLKAIASNTCNTWLAKRTSSIPLDEAEMLPSYATQVTDRWRLHELRADVLSAVHALPEGSRIVVTLHYLSGLSCLEISESLGVSVATVEKRLSRARRQLRVEMLGAVEKTFVEKRLPHTFAQDVLRRLSLFPIATGNIISIRNGDAEAIVLRVGQEGEGPKLVSVSMGFADAEAVCFSTKMSSKSAYAKAHALASMVQIIGAFEISVREVVLYLDDSRHCRAKVKFRQHDQDQVLDMRPSDALSLAYRLETPIFADESVVEQQEVGEDGFKCSCEIPLGDLTPELYRGHQLNLLHDIAFKNGLSPEDGCDRIRLRPDRSKGILYLGIGDSPDLLELDLMGYRDTVNALEKEIHPGRGPSSFQHDDGRIFSTYYEKHGEEFHIVLVPVHNIQDAFGAPPGRGQE